MVGDREMTFLRAHGEEQKQIRIQQILDATASLYEEIGYDKVTFSKISKSVNFSRINLYNYFSCKEDIFLLIILQDIEDMVEDAKVSLDRQMSNVEFIDNWTNVIMRHQRMLALLGIVNTVILKDASTENHLNYRAEMNKLFWQLGDVFVKVVQCLKKENVMNFIDFENSYAMTLYPASKEYKERYNIEIFPNAGYGTHPFAEQYKAYLKVLLAGMQDV